MNRKTPEIVYHREKIDVLQSRDRYTRDTMILTLALWGGRYRSQGLDLDPACFTITARVSILVVDSKSKLISKDRRPHNTGIQMKRKELTKTFVIISH